MFLHTYPYFEETAPAQYGHAIGVQRAIQSLKKEPNSSKTLSKVSPTRIVK